MSHELAEWLPRVVLFFAGGCAVATVLFFAGIGFVATFGPYKITPKR